MGEKSKIEWTDATWNPTRGCSLVSEGCRNCYAMRVAHRFNGVGQPYEGLTNENGKWNGNIRLVPEKLDEPLRWKRARMVFVDSMSDLFHDDVPFEFIDRVFAVMNMTRFQLPLPADPYQAKRWHTYQLLTKRPKRMAEYLDSRSPRHYRNGEHPLFKHRDLARGKGSALMNSSAVLSWPLPNVWLGVSVEDQATADERIPHLLKCPAAVRFLSAEPLLGAIDLRQVSQLQSGHKLGHYIDWVIVGGESGHGARPCDALWVHSIVEQCRAASVPCFVKQLGSNSVLADASNRQPWKDKKGGDAEEWPEKLRVREWP